MGRPVTNMRVFTSHERREIRAFLIEKYGTDCQICKRPIDMHSQREPNSFSIDHILALADGGANEKENMHPTHIKCNNLKGSLKSPGTPRKARANRRVATRAKVSGVRLAYTSGSW